MVKVNLLVLFLTLEENLSIFHNWVWCPLWGFHIQILLCWGVMSSHSLVHVFIIKNVLNHVKCFLCNNWDNHYGFSPCQYVNVTYYNDSFSYVGPSLNSGYKSDLVRVDNPFSFEKTCHRAHIILLFQITKI